MEDSQVLDAESKSAPLQAPEAIIQTSESIAPQNETPNKNIYGGPSPVVGEQDHVSDITRNINRSDYNTSSAVDQSAEPVVSTISTTKGNVTEPTYWKDHYGMEDTYKAKEGEDYSWNRLAQERSQYTYNQEATQVLSDYAKSMAEIKEAGAQAMDQYFSAVYGANQTADKMGWSGGQVTSNDAKTAFLKASTAAGMFDKFELQKYGVDSQLQVARMYADANMEALALDLYQDAIDTAVREAELTGYYIAPECSEMMKQQKVAQDIIKDPNASKADKQRANNVIGAANNYFDKLGFERDPKTGQYIGIKTLGTLEFEETKRNNQIQEKLTEDANQIAREGVDATRQAANNSYILGLRQLEANQNLSERMDWIEATKMYGSNGFAKDGNGNYREVNIVSEHDGKVYGTIDGKLYEYTPEGGVLTKGKELDSSKYFSNGYQPRSVDGHGEVKTSGTKIVVQDNVNNKAVTQNLWKTSDGKYWIWDGVNNKYHEVKGDTLTVTIDKNKNFKVDSWE